MTNPFETTPEALENQRKERQAARKALNAFIAAHKGDDFLFLESARTLTHLATQYSRAYGTSIDTIVMEVLDELIAEVTRG